MWHDRNSFYDGKQRYKIVENWHEEGERVIADGFTSQKAVMEYRRKLRKQGIDTKKLMTVAYK